MVFAAHRADNLKIYIRVRRPVHAFFTIENSPLITLLNEHARVQWNTHEIKNKKNWENLILLVFLGFIKRFERKKIFFAAKKSNKSVYVRVQKYIILLRLSRLFSDQACVYAIVLTQVAVHKTQPHARTYSYRDRTPNENINLIALKIIIVIFDSMLLARTPPVVHRF